MLQAMLTEFLGESDLSSCLDASVSPSMYPGKTKQKIRSVQSQQKSKTFFPV
jgi:hypothetical protein